MKINNMTPQNLKGLQGKGIPKKTDPVCVKDDFSQSSIKEKPDFMKLKDNIPSSKPSEVKEEKGFSKPLLYAGLAIGAAGFVGGLTIPGAAMLMPAGVALGGSLMYLARPKDGGEGNVQQNEVKPTENTSPLLSKLGSKEVKSMAKTGIQAIKDCNYSDGAKIGKSFLDEVEKIVPDSDKAIFNAIRGTLSLRPDSKGAYYSTYMALDKLSDGKSGLNLLTSTALNSIRECGYSDGAKIGKAFLNEIEKNTSENKIPLFNAIRGTLSQGPDSKGAYYSTYMALDKLSDGKSGLQLLTSTALSSIRECGYSDGAKIGKAFLDEAEKILPEDKKPLFNAIRGTLSQRPDSKGAYYSTYMALNKLSDGKSDLQLLTSTALNSIRECGYSDGAKIGKAFLNEIEKNSSENKIPLFNAIRGTLSQGPDSKGAYYSTYMALDNLSDGKSGLQLLTSTALSSMRECGYSDGVKIGKAFLNEIEKQVPANKKALIRAALSNTSSSSSAYEAIYAVLEDI